MYQIEYSSKAIKVLRVIPQNIRDKIMGKVSRLAENPHLENNNVKKLRGRNGFRLRVGDWRVIYEVDRGKITIFVIDVGTRGGIYE